MTINARIESFDGLPIVEYPQEGRPADPGAVAWRIETPDWEDNEAFTQRLTDFVREPWAGQVTTLVIGLWGECFENPAPVAELVAAAKCLTSLRALFIGEVTFDECEISWIKQTDVTPIFQAYPNLRVLTIRGAEDLSLQPVRHASLRRLTFQSGGLPRAVVRAVDACEFPALEHLELWFGSASYGGNATADDIRQILAGTRLPALTSLGLRDAEITDHLAAALAGAPVVARLKELDLSMGLLTDTGASALLGGQPLTHLRRLNLRHHFLSQPLADRIADELGAAGVDVDLTDGAPNAAEDDRYVQVSE